MEEILFAQNNQMLFYTCLISGILAAVISVYFLKIYRVFSSTHIFGLVIGFALVSFSDFFFSATLAAANQNEIFNVLHWLQLSVASYGFVFIGLVYYFKKSTEKKFKLVTKTTMISLIPIGLSLIITGITDNSVLPDFQQYNEYFRIINLMSLGYIIFKIGSNPDLQNRIDLFLLPFGFGIVFLAQFIRLLFTVDPTSSTLIISIVLKIIGLGIIIFALARKLKNPEMTKKSVSYDT